MPVVSVGSATRYGFPSCFVLFQGPLYRAKEPTWLGSRRADSLGSVAPFHSRASFIAVPAGSIVSLARKALMKTLLGRAIGTLPLLTSGVALAQAGNMMDGSGWGMGWMGGYGGIWGPLLLVVVVVGVVALVMQRKGK